MPKTRNIPAYQLHRATGQARVRIEGIDHYLGKHGSQSSHDRYDELIAQFLQASREAPATAPRTLSAVLAAWWRECKLRYGDRGKGRYGNAVCWRPVIRLLRENFGDKPADRLGPAALRRLIEEEAERRKWSLRYSKDVLAKVKLIFKWAKNEELLASSTYDRIRDVEIRNGRQTAPVLPVDDKLVQQTLPHLKPVVAAMVQLQRLTGCRPGILIVASGKNECRYTGGREPETRRNQRGFLAW